MGKLLEMSLVTVVVALVCILNASGAWSQADPGPQNQLSLNLVVCSSLYLKLTQTKMAIIPEK